MSSVRKLKLRAIARLGEPMVQLRYSEELLRHLGAMTSIQRENMIRAACKSYIKARLKGELG